MAYPGIDENRLRRLFIDEAEELLEKLNRCLLELEKKPDDPALIQEAFRLTHSVKSEASAMRLSHLADVAHRLEDVFDKVREGSVVLTRAQMDGIFSGCDMLIEMLGRIAGGAANDDFDTRALFADLDRLFAPAGPSSTGESRIDPQAPLWLTEFEKAQVREAAERGEKLYRLVFQVNEDEPMKYPRAYLVFNNLEQITNLIRTSPDLATGEGDDRIYGKVTALLATHRPESDLAQAVRVDQVEEVVWSALDPATLLSGAAAGVENGPETAAAARPASVPAGPLPQAPAPSQATAPPADAGHAGAEGERPAGDVPAPVRLEKTFIKVETRKLNDLWQLIGELIINKTRLNRLVGQISGLDEACYKNVEGIADALERIAAGMQHTMVGTRMVPISTAFGKISRLVRDLSGSLGKEADLELHGEDTEIDRGVVEVLSEPLTHLIKNSLDHGLETGEERQRLGKPRRGRIIVSARQEAGRVFIEISDDGRGLDLVKIRQKAGVPADLNDEETARLIFRHGLTTRDSVTVHAGRGVGMDVVDRRIREELGGKVLVRSEAGRGTTMTIVLPLALNILNTLIVACGDRPYAIPVQSIDETVKTAPQDVVAGNGDRRLLYRQGVIPLLALEELLGLPQGSPPEERYGVILQAREERTCLLVDQLIEEQELVIKPVDALLNERRLFSGVSVLGDGRIVFVLDAATIGEIGRARGRRHGDPSSAGR